MTGALADSLHFTAHLFALTVAFGAAFVVLGDSSEQRVFRLLAPLGFLALAAAEAVHGAGFQGEAGDWPLLLRTAGFGAIALTGLIGRPGTRASHAFLAFPGRVIPPAIAAALAAVTTVLRRRDGRHLLLGGGLLVLAAAEGLLALRDDVAWALDGYHLVRTAGFALVAVFVLATTRRSLQFRMIAAFVSLLLVIVLGVSAAVTQIIGRNLREGTLNRVSAQALDIAQGMREEIGDRTENLRVLGQFANVLTSSPSDFRVYHEQLFADVDVLLALDEDLEILRVSGIDRAAALEIVGTPVVQAADAGSSVTDLGGDLVAVGVRPVERALEGGGTETAGFVVAAFRFDGEFLDFLSPAGTRVAAFRFLRDQPVAAVGLGEDDGTAAPVVTGEVLGAVREALNSGAEVEARPLRVAGDRSFGAFVPLREPTVGPVGILLVAEPAAILGQTTSEVNRVIFLVTLGLVGLALLLVFFLTQRITHPIRALTRATRRVQAGDLEAKAPVVGHDEVGDLATAFNQMTDSISLMNDELRAAATQQASLRNRLETVINSMSDGLIAVDEDGRVVTFNRAAATILGKQRGRVIGKTIGEVIRLRDEEGGTVPLEGDIPAGLAFVVRRRGGDVPVAVASSPLRDEGGQTSGRVYVIRDMSREHEVERMKSEFLANVSHELRTPLTPIIGYSEILQKKEVPAERAREFARGILESARRLERIVAMLLDFSAMEGGRLSITAEPTAVRPLVGEVIDRWKARSERHRFVTRLEPRLPKALADVQLVTRTLDELLDNAVKYSPDGGQITVTAVYANAQRRGMLRLTVSDEGIGIAPEDLRDIFEDFRQVDASDTRNFGGLGLGLAFVQRIVEAHGGKITAESQPGKGASFTFTLPTAGGGEESS